MPLHLEIVTPKGKVLAADAEEVLAPGKQGQLGFLPGHIPLLAALRPGVLTYRDGVTTHRLAISKGFVEVGADEKVLVLTDDHAFAKDLQLDAVQTDRQRAEAALKGWTGQLEDLDAETNTWKVNPEHEDLLDQLAWAEAKLQLLS